MKNFKLFNQLLVLLVVLILGNTHAWAYTIWHANIYYDDLESGWNSDVCIALEKGSNQPGDGNGGATISMTHISNTKLWYWYGESWGSDAVHYFRFAKITGTKYNWYDWWKNSSTDRVEDTWTWYQTENWAGVSGGYGESVNNETKLYVSSSSLPGASITSNSLTSYTAMNFTQTLQQHLSTNGGVYGATTDAIATVKVSSYYLTGASTSAATGDCTISSGDSSTTCTAARTAVVTYTVSNVKPGYKFVGWYDGNTEKSTATTYNYNASSAKTITARFVKQYAFIEGRFAIYNQARDTKAYTASNGTWTTSATTIPMTYDETNKRFYVHTYSTPAELQAQINSQDPYFIVKTSSRSASVNSEGYEHFASANTDAAKKLTAAGYANAKNTNTSSAPGSFTFIGNSSTTDEYVILYCDGSKIWYTLEQKLTYNGNGNTGGSAPSMSYKDKSSTVTVASKPADLVKNGYIFGGWNTANDGSGSNYTAGTGTFSITADTELFAKWTQEVTLHDKHGQNHNGSVVATYNATSVASLSAPTLASCSVEGYYADEDFEHKVMTAAGALVNYSGYVESGKWVHSGPTTLYTKWTSDNFVIYRTGDKSEDVRSNYDQVETYAGGTISKTIEYRMKVQEGLWYSLCLPFTVNAVKVWDEEDNLSYNIVPYHRSTPGAKLYEGHYVIRTPNGTPSATTLKISDFGNWIDASSSDAMPDKNKPYIILWHSIDNSNYFNNKYVSFFGASGQEILNEMTEGTSSGLADDEVKICVNDAMKSTNVAGAYTLENDYGGGAWLQNDDASARTVLPFECYLLTKDGAAVSSPLRPRNAFDETNTATGWEDVIYGDKQEQITVYTITGALVGQYNNCSMNDVKGKLKAENKEGIFILRAGSESVKLMIGSK